MTVVVVVRPVTVVVVVRPVFTQLPNAAVSFYAVIDGHGGSEAGEYVQKVHIPRLVGLLGSLTVLPGLLHYARVAC